MNKYTAAIIGSGPAGHTCAIRIAQLGGKVAVVERDHVGGICTNWGCTPSKSMIESAKVARVLRESNKYGISVPNYAVDFQKVAARRDHVIEKARKEVVQRLTHYGVDIYQGEAEVIAVVYSIPEVAEIGTVPTDLTGVSVYKVPFSANLRAQIGAYTEGFIKIWVKDNTVRTRHTLKSHGRLWNMRSARRLTFTNNETQSNLEGNPCLTYL
jgi:pyruvate/2-oxoglutarate dehydrogenase complex dihydrolipoamide dehydrogenase (E3) component